MRLSQFGFCLIYLNPSCPTYVIQPIKYPPRPLKTERSYVFGAMGKVEMTSLAHPSSSHCQLKSFVSQWTSLRLNVASNDYGMNDHYHRHHRHHRQTMTWPLLLLVWFIAMNCRIRFQSIIRIRKTSTSLVPPHLTWVLPSEMFSSTCLPWFQHQEQMWPSSRWLSLPKFLTSEVKASINF